MSMTELPDYVDPETLVRRPPPDAWKMTLEEQGRELARQRVLVECLWTRVLVDELKKREGVPMVLEVLPHQDAEITLKLSGPTILMKIID